MRRIEELKQMKIGEWIVIFQLSILMALHFV